MTTQQQHDHFIQLMETYNYKAADEFIASGFDVNSIIFNKNSEYHFIFSLLSKSHDSRQKREWLTYLFKHGFNPNFYVQRANRMYLSPLLLSYYVGDYSTLLFLINNGADVNQKEPQMFDTVLHEAAHEGKFKKFMWLIKHGADPLQENCYGVSPVKRLEQEHPDLFNEYILRNRKLKLDNIKKIIKKKQKTN